jgi:PAS domain-containing protein
LREHHFEELIGMFAEAPIGLCCFDTNLRFVFINNFLAELNGISVEEHLGRSIREVIPDVAAGVEVQLRHVIETGEPIVGGEVDAETPAHPGLRRSFQHHYYAIRSEAGTDLKVACVVQ